MPTPRGPKLAIRTAPYCTRVARRSSTFLSTSVWQSWPQILLLSFLSAFFFLFLFIVSQCFKAMQSPRLPAYICPCFVSLRRPPDVLTADISSCPAVSVSLPALAYRYPCSRPGSPPCWYNYFLPPHSQPPPPNRLLLNSFLPVRRASSLLHPQVLLPIWSRLLEPELCGASLDGLTQAASTTCASRSLPSSTRRQFTNANH